MGGVNKSENFLLNCSAWGKLYANEDASKIERLSPEQIYSILRMAPVTGAEQNLGWPDEESFYDEFFSTLYNSRFQISIGDGCPDKKLLYGMRAIQNIQKEKDRTYKAAVFLKPYPEENLVNRIAWVSDIASHIGIDIDAYNIVTMRNQVQLEKKTSDQIKWLMKKTTRPFVLKGIFTREDLELVKEAKPDVAYISNHGGRVETRRGSTATFLKAAAPMLKKYCGEIWVDGGIRCKRDIELAHYYGASQVLVARPVLRSFLYEKQSGIEQFLK